MTKGIKREQIKIDAEGKVLGRLSVEVSNILRGKNLATFEPHKDDGPVVSVYNISKIKITGDKLKQKVYYHHSNYLGGIKETKMEDLMKNRPEEVVKRAVWGMLPKNRLRERMMTRLKLFGGQIK